MTRPILLLAHAEDDLAEARDWYEAKRKGLGDEFLVAVGELFGRIRLHPRLYPKVYGALRRAVMRRFPYLVYFLENDDSVTIVGCLHLRRRQDIVKTRL